MVSSAPVPPRFQRWRWPGEASGRQHLRADPSSVGIWGRRSRPRGRRQPSPEPAQELPESQRQQRSEVTAVSGETLLPCVSWDARMRFKGRSDPWAVPGSRPLRYCGGPMGTRAARGGTGSADRPVRWRWGRGGSRALRNRRWHRSWVRSAFLRPRPTPAFAPPFGPLPANNSGLGNSGHQVKEGGFVACSGM